MMPATWRKVINYTNYIRTDFRRKRLEDTEGFDTDRGTELPTNLKPCLTNSDDYFTGNFTRLYLKDNDSSCWQISSVDAFHYSQPTLLCYHLWSYLWSASIVRDTSRASSPRSGSILRRDINLNHNSGLIPNNHDSRRQTNARVIDTSA